MKLRFALSEETFAALAETKPVGKLEQREDVLAALRPLLGSKWATKSRAFIALKDAVVETGLLWPSGAPFAKAVRETVGVRDPEGEAN